MFKLSRFLLILILAINESLQATNYYESCKFVYKNFRCNEKLSKRLSKFAFFLKTIKQLLNLVQNL